MFVTLIITLTPDTKSLGDFLKKGLGGVIDAAIPKSPVDVKKVLEHNPNSVEALLLREMQKRTLKMVKGMALADIVRATDDLATSTNEFMCGLDQAEPSIQSG